MSQLNMHTSPDFENTLHRYMSIRGIHTKSEAVRCAVKEALEHATSQTAVDFKTWIGLAKSKPLNPKPRFTSDADLWH